MAPRWPQINIGPEHINEHATYLREACTQLQAVDRGRQNQIPWNIVQPYLESTIALISKVLRQPAIGEILQQVQNAAKCTQNIQNDVTIIKNSVGLSTTPLNATNFSGGRNTTLSWAQVAAQAKGSPPLPPPAPQGTPATKTQSVTAYKDRVVTVKLKDHGIAQRYRRHPASWTKQQVEISIHDNPATKPVKVVAAHQLKSGDLQIFTSTTAEATQLKENRGWLRGLGEHAELIVPTYGVIVHGISTKSINTKDQNATSQQVLADNYTVIPDAKISYIGWLTKEATLKRASSIVVEFTDPEMANAVIYAGMAWDGQIHQCQLYDRACRVKQCFRCYNYGHIGTQCNASQVCGYCAEQHETKHCKQKGMEGFTPQCAVCKDAHTAWSNACPARRKEMRRVEQAKEARSIYWHVPMKERTTPPGTRNTRVVNARQENHIRASPIPAQMASQRSEDGTEPTAAGISTTIHVEHQTCPPTTQQASQLTEQTPQQMPLPAETQVPVETTTTQDPVTLPIEDVWEPPPMQQETAQQCDPTIDPQLGTVEESFPTQISEENQPISYTTEGIEGAVMQEADTWLEDMVNNNNDWLHDLAEVQPSPLTSMATDTRTALGKIYKGCKCPSHQGLYSGWPTQDADLIIAKCMRICMYCGKDFPVAAELRKHLGKKPDYAQRNLTVHIETAGRGSSLTPGWTPKYRTEPPARRSEAGRTRSQSLTNSTNAVPPL